MTGFSGRIHRIELPPIPKTNNPDVLREAMQRNNRIMTDEFNRLATDLYDFKKATYEAAILPLKGVSLITVTPTAFGMSATWENPQPDGITPTHVRVRIFEITPNDWAEYTYPIDAWTFSGLTEGAQYTLQVQLVSRFEATETFVSTTRNCPSVPVLRVAESDIRSKVFTTLPGVRAPVDAKINTTTVDFVFPNPPGGTPGAVDSAFCWWEYGFQRLAEVIPTVYEWIDFGSTYEEAGDIGAVDVNLDAAPFTTYASGTFRMKYREVCNGTPGSWTYTPSFVKFEINVPCGGLVPSITAAQPPYLSADMFTVVPCMEVAEWLKIEDGISGREYTPQLPGYRNYARADDEWTVFAANTANRAISPRTHMPILTNNLPLIGALHSTSDFSFSISLYLPELSLTFIPVPWEILNLGTKIKLFVSQDSASYNVIVQIPRDGGGVYMLRGDNLAPDAWNSILYSHDASDPAGRVLFINGIEADRSAGVIDIDLDGIDNSFKLSTFNEQRTRQLYGWNRVVEEAELPFPPEAEYYMSNITLGKPSVTLAVGDVVITGQVIRRAFAPPHGAPATLGSNSWTQLPPAAMNFDSQTIAGAIGCNCWVSQITTAGTYSLDSLGSPSHQARMYAVYRGLIPPGGVWQDYVRYAGGLTGPNLNFNNLTLTADGPPSGCERLMFVGIGDFGGLLPVTWTGGSVTREATSERSGDFGVSHIIGTLSNATADPRGSVTNYSAGTCLMVIDVRRQIADPFVGVVRHIASLGNKDDNAPVSSVVIPISGAASFVTGDLIVVSILGRSTVTGPAGFTKIAESSVFYSPAPPFTQFSQFWIARQGIDATLTPGGTLTFTNSASGRLVGSIQQFRSSSGVFDLTPVKNTRSQINVAATTYPTPTLTGHKRGIAIMLITNVLPGAAWGVVPTGWTGIVVGAPLDTRTLLSRKDQSTANISSVTVTPVNAQNAHYVAGVVMVISGA